MNKILSIASTIGLAALMTACDPYADLCHEQHPNEGTLYLAWEWPDNFVRANSVDIANDTVTVLAVRKENICKYIGKQARPASNRWTPYIHRTYPEAEGLYDANGVLAWDKNHMHSGKYDVMSFNSNGGYQFTVDYSDFLSMNTDYFRVVRFTINSYAQSETKNNPALIEFGDITQRPAYAGTEFLAPYTNEMYWAEEKNVEISTNKTTKCKFQKLQRITQAVTITLNVNKLDPDMYISSVRGVISGVPSNMNVVTSEMNCEKTYSAVFNAKCEDSFKGTTAKVTVAIPLLGILPGEAGDDWVTGRGKLHICLNTLTHDASGNLVAGDPMWAAFDLTTLLNSRNSISLASNNYGKQSGKTFTLPISRALRISKTGVDTPKNDTDWHDITTKTSLVVGAATSTETESTND